MTTYAFVRLDRISSIQAMRAASEHAARRNASAARRMRPGADHTKRAVGWTIQSRAGWIGTTRPKTPLPAQADYLAAFKARKATAGARERKGSALALHAMVGVSPRWVEQTGSPHDIGNPRVKELIKAARLWGDQAFGPGSVVAVRYDVDEKGSAVVDMVLVPVRDLRLGRARIAKPTISVSRALDDLAQKHGRHRRSDFSAAQDDWATFARQHLDATIVRGRPKIETGREHLEPDAFAEARERERRELKRRRDRARREAEAAEADRRRAFEAAAAAERERTMQETERDRAVADAAAARAERDAAYAEAREAESLLQHWLSRLGQASEILLRALGPRPPAPPDDPTQEANDTDHQSRL